MTEFEKLLNDLNLTVEDQKTIQTWANFQGKIDSFINKANLSLFENLFGETEGNRLIQHFIYDCKRDFKRFLTYLIRDQRNKTFSHIQNSY